MKNKLILAALLIGLLTGKEGFAQSVADYLILQDIGQYNLSKPEKLIPGFKLIGGPRIYDSAGAIASTGHFVDHIDKTYEVMYLGGDTYASPTVQITQHTQGDSDKWLLHEVEDGYRDDEKLNATVDTNVQMRSIDGKNVYFIGIYGGKSYSWVANNNIVVDITCSSCPNTKPEPIDIVKAYLVKHPSIITIVDADLKSKVHSEAWIKDEMERRLWLGDKWYAQIQAADSKLRVKLKSMTSSMVVFLNYREKYYGIASKNDKIALETALFQDNISAIQAKLTEYKGWWSAHKSDPITLP